MALGCILAILAAAASAPDAGTPATVVEEIIVVTPERGRTERDAVPAPVTVLEAERLEALPAASLAEALQAVPGFLVLSPGGGSGRPVVANRGFFGGGEADYLRLLLDGIPLARVESGLVEWDAPLLAQLSRVEVMRGPGTALHGDGAMGGVVQALSAARPVASLLADSFGSVGGTVLWAPGGKRGRLAASLLAGEGARTGSERTLASLRGATTIGVAGHRLALALRSSDRAEPGPLPLALARRRPRAADPVFADDREQRVGATLSLDSAFAGGAGRSRGFVSLTRGEDVRSILLAPGLPDRAERELATAAAGATVDREWHPGRRTSVRAGLEAGLERLESDYATPGAGKVASAAGDRTRGAGFLTGYWQGPAGLEVSLGTRWDWIEDSFATRDTDRALSPRLGLTWRPERWPVALFVQASRSFRAPTLDQKFDVRPFPDFGGGAFTISNPDLEPQRATNLELGASTRTPRLQAELSLYHMTVEDEIDFDLATFRYQNLGDSLHRGVEAALRAPLGRLTPRLAYFYSEVEPTRGSHRGRQLKNVPRHALQVGAALRLPYRFAVDAFYSRAWERYLDDANRWPLGPLERLDLRLSRALGVHRLALDLLNVTGESEPEYGFVLTDFADDAVPYAFPAAPFGARLTLYLDLE